MNELLAASLKRTGHLLTIEEGGYTMGWGAEIAARVAAQSSTGLIKVQRLAAADQPIPASVTLEDAVLPSIDDIMAAVQRMV